MKVFFCVMIFVIFCFRIISAQTEAGNALSLDGNDSYAWVPDNPALNPQTQITLEAWVWSSNYNGGSWQEFIMKGGNVPSQPRQYYIRPFRGEGTLEFLVHDTDNNGIAVGSSEILTNGQWYHIAGTYDGQFIRCYVNGRLEDESEEGQFSIQTSDGILAFGRLGEIDAEYFEGKIDEVRIWNVARTQAQLISTINDTLSQEYYSSPDSGLIGYWRFDVLEDLGINSDGADDVRDLSVYGNHADLENNSVLVISNALVSVNKLNKSIPEQFYLSQNYPNPFNPATKIKYQIPELSIVTLKIYDVLGSEVATIVNEEKLGGSYEVEFEGSDLPSSIYFYRLQAGNYVETKKMILLK